MHFSSQNTTFSRGRCPLAAPKSYKLINFDRKGTESVHLWFPKIHILLRKEGLPPCDHQKSYISVNLDQKEPKIMHI